MTEYRASAEHMLTIAAIYTPFGQPIANVRETHDAHCTTCRQETQA